MLLLGSGTFVKNPEITEVGTTVKTSFSLVYNETYKDKTGEKTNIAHYLDCEAWDSAAKYIVKHCQKGDKIFIKAYPRQEKWESNGQKKQRIVFRITEFDVFRYAEDEEV